jgi:hypothetical protein
MINGKIFLLKTKTTLVIEVASMVNNHKEINLLRGSNAE